MVHIILQVSTRSAVASHDMLPMFLQALHYEKKLIENDVMNTLQCWHVQVFRLGTSKMRQEYKNVLDALLPFSS